MKKKIIAIITASILVAGLILCYSYKNPVLKLFAPKRYVYLCMNTFFDDVEDEFNYGRISDSMKGYTLNLDLKREDTDKINLSLSSDDKIVYGSLKQLLGDDIAGTFQGSEFVKEKLSFPNIYNKALKLQNSTQKIITRDNSSPEDITEYSFTLDHDGVYSLTDFAFKWLFKDTPKDNNTEIYRLLDKYYSESVIVIGIDGRGRITNIKNTYSINNNEYYIELEFLNKKTYINHATLLFCISGEKNISMNLDSSGTHKIENKLFSDETKIKIVKSYLEIADITLTTKIDYTKQKENITTDVSGSIAMQPMHINSMGDLLQTKTEMNLNQKYTVDIIKPNMEDLNPIVAELAKDLYEKWIDFNDNYYLTFNYKAMNKVPYAKFTPIFKYRIKDLHWKW